MAEPIILGSGELFAGDIVDLDTATEEEITEVLVKIGEIESGATLTYEPTVQTIRGGKNNRVLATWVTQEDVTFSTGLITFDTKNMQLLAPSTYTEEKDTDNKVVKKTIKIGGQNRGNLKVSYLRFIHEKKDGGELTINIARAANIAGFEMEFNVENPTVINHEFIAQASTDGTLVEIVETFV